MCYIISHMLDIKFIRENTELIASAAKKKRIDFDVQKLVEADEKRKVLLAKIEEKRAEQNAASMQIVNASPEEKSAILERMKILKAELETEQEEFKGVMHEWQMLMLQVPNVPDISVPDGESDKEN